jgi:hypothetical protein
MISFGRTSLPLEMIGLSKMFSKFPKSLLWRSGIKVLRRATPAGFSKEAGRSFIGKGSYINI